MNAIDANQCAFYSLTPLPAHQKCVLAHSSDNYGILNIPSRAPVKVDSYCDTML